VEFTATFGLDLSDSGVPFGQWLAPGFYVVELND
jgi:hypothetical protein